MRPLVYSRTKALRFREEVEALPLESGRILAPVMVRIKPTNVCNHDCRYCAYAAENLDAFGKASGRDRRSIPAEKLAEIAEDLVAMRVRSVALSGGGEPLLHPGLPAFLRALAAGGVRFGALTNGSRLEGEAAEIFAERGTWVRVSIDGWDDESYARYRGVRPGEWTRVMENMRRFKALGGRCYLGVSLIVDAENAPHVGGFLAALAEIGVESVKVSPCLAGVEAGSAARGAGAVAETVRDEVARARAALGDRLEIHDACGLPPEDFAKPYGWCPYAQLAPVVGADLEVYPCPDKAYRAGGSLGSIASTRFRDLWFSEKARFFRIDPSRDCRHHCERDAANRLVWEHVHTDPEHGLFV